MKIRVLGTGVIPRGLGLAPRLAPFPADKVLISTILAAGFKVEFVHPEKGIFIELNKKNFVKMYEKYGNMDVKITPPVNPSTPENNSNDGEDEDLEDPVDDETDGETGDETDGDNSDGEIDDEEDGGNDEEEDSSTGSVVSPKVSETEAELQAQSETDKVHVEPKVANNTAEQNNTVASSGVVQPKVSEGVQNTQQAAIKPAGNQSAITPKISGATTQVNKGKNKNKGNKK